MFQKHEIKEFGIKSLVMLHLKRIRRKERGNITWRKQRKCKKERRKVERKGRKENEITKSSIRFISAP